ncbi:unnamed protein product [Lactuca saligna]|uniref:Uncharacterized protein n=1 Tax=Lactuca saligna TaxID=75948 RepID=A0AA35Z3T5_LACSI|nr:unnamed protein product [Lactuca saligna]
MITDHYGLSVDELMPSIVNKIFGFELICRSLGYVPTFWVFSYFFCLTTDSRVRTLAKRRGIRQLISEQDAPRKNQQRQWLWVNQNLGGHGYRRTRNFSNRLPKLFGSNLTLGKHLGNITITGWNREDFILAVANMIAAWRARRKMALMFVVRCGAEAEISLEMALHGHYNCKLCHHEIDLTETLTPRLSERRMQELAGLPVVEREMWVLAGMRHLTSRPLALFPWFFRQFTSLVVCLWEKKQEEIMLLFEGGVVCVWCHRRMRRENMMMWVFVLRKS